MSLYLTHMTHMKEQFRKSGDPRSAETCFFSSQAFDHCLQKDRETVFDLVRQYHELERNFVCESPIIYILDQDGFRAVDPSGLPLFHTMKSRDSERPVDFFGEEYFYEDLDFTHGCECLAQRREDVESFRLVYRKFKSYVETKNDCQSLFVKKSLGMRSRFFPTNIEWLIRQQDVSCFVDLEEWRQETEILCSLFSKAMIARKNFDRTKAARAMRWLDLLSGLNGVKFHLYAKGATKPVHVTLYKNVQETP